MLLIQFRLAVAQRGQLLLVVIELFGVVLHQLLLAADVVQAVDIRRMRSSSVGQVANLIAIVFASARSFSAICDLLIGDALQLAASGVAEGRVLNVGRERSRASSSVTWYV